MSQEPLSKLSSAGTDFVSKLHNDSYPAIDPTKSNLTGKTVFITGASKGIGRATAISFAKAGTSTIILGARSSLDEVSEEVSSAASKAGHPAPKVITLNLDVSSQDSVEKAVSELQKTHSIQSIDILINNAGYLETWKKVQDSDPTSWWTSWQINVLGTYLVSRSLLPLVLASPTKTILNITSVGANFVKSGASAYQTTKLAVCRFTEFLVEENKEEGLLAYCAHPGGVSTELARGMPEYMMAALKDTPELAGDTFVAWTAERREWLAGRYLSVCWDLEALEAKKEEIVKGDLLKMRMAVGGLE